MFSHTESRVFTHHRLTEIIDPKGGKDHFLRLNLLNDSYLTESFNVSVASSSRREKVKWNRPMADAPSFRAAYGVTRAAQAPLARRGRSREGVAGTCRSDRQERGEGREGAFHVPSALVATNVTSRA